jgi:DNA invertase Pin-like site-specific DNA recombinase
MNQRPECVLAFTRTGSAKLYNQNLQKQRREIFKYAVSSGISIDGFVEAVGSGGSAIKLLDGVIELLKKGDLLIITEASRISRSTIELSRIMDTLKGKGVKLVLTGQIVNKTHNSSQAN